MNEDIFHLGVKAIIRNTAGDILLLKVNVEELKNYSGEPYWDIPGGRIHKGGSIEETLKREVEEETGIKKIKRIIPLYMTLSKIRIPVENGDVGLILSVHTCEVGENNNIFISKEHTEYGWFSPQETANLLKFKYPPEFTNVLEKL